jgi:organic radical activating enzyme
MIEGTYSIEANWVINKLCNYHCTYCWSRSDVEQAGVLTLTPLQYADFFDRSNRTWMLCITGGEPFVYAKVVDVMEAITENHFISINTNGSQTQRINDFVKRVRPSRVQSIHIGLHPAERTGTDGWKTLIENIRVLKQHGFEVFASAVMAPQVILQFPRAYALMMKDADCVLLPKLLRDATYPKAYTFSEQALIESYIDRILSDFPDLKDRPYTVNPIHDRDYVSGFPDFRDTTAAREWILCGSTSGGRSGGVSSRNASEI